MTIVHARIVLKQDCDLNAVKEIVNAYKGAKLDEINYIVYYNSEMPNTTKLVDELHYFTYGIRLTSEEF